MLSLREFLHARVCVCVCVCACVWMCVWVCRCIRIKYIRKKLTYFCVKRCVDGHLRLWDGMRQPGMYAFPYHSFCGWYPSGDIDVTKVTSQNAADLEFYVKAANEMFTFVLTFKYIDFGEFKVLN